LTLVAGIDCYVRADSIVALDACFTQKRGKDPDKPDHRDCPNHHPESAFLSEQDVEAMEEYVAAQRATKATRKTREDDSQEDGFEDGMKVPTSVLNDCGDSFKAADEKREKASTQFFADTGLMALLCRHDRVLWIVNMIHAGERQHYALALIQRLFEHIPAEMTVGVLYDIGCQLHRSCLKWRFLQEYHPRIIFAISVFHAFGHQWPCQIVYHPRKCLGFGLSDGEGCERFWSAIRMLIPSLRVSGVSNFMSLYC
jgi:Kyakuja-Dileera-Zisupton transposase